jgi:hypothetical protein
MPGPPWTGVGGMDNRPLGHDNALTGAGLWPLRGSEAHWRGSGMERGGWKTRYEAHPGVRGGDAAG